MLIHMTKLLSYTSRTIVDNFDRDITWASTDRYIIWSLVKLICLIRLLSTEVPEGIDNCHNSNCKWAFQMRVVKHFLGYN